MRLLAALLALALALAGCGGSGGDGGETARQRARRRARRGRRRWSCRRPSDGFDAAEVYREAAPGRGHDPLDLRRSGAAEGSGFVLDTDGRIVTNAHVVTDERAATTASRPRRSSSSSPTATSSPAKIVGFDPFADVALLEVEPDGFDLHPLELGDDRDLVVGQPVAAIGSPFGEQQSLSVGVVSATDRSVESLTQFQIEGAIQTDASINPGNSGGPLLDAGARVIGINQQIETDSGANDGVGFAVPISAVKRSLAQLERRRRGRIRLHRRLHPGALPAARRQARPRHRLRRPARRSRPGRPGRRGRAARAATANSASRACPTKPAAT